MKRILTLLLCAALALPLAVPVLAAQSEQETAAAWLKKNGILSGDQNCCRGHWVVGAELLVAVPGH